jgi:hypothetical protein
MAKITIVELQAVGSGENFAESVRDLCVNELGVVKGGGGHEYEGKEKEKEYEKEEKKKKYSYYPCYD